MVALLLKAELIRIVTLTTMQERAASVPPSQWFGWLYPHASVPMDEPYPPPACQPTPPAKSVYCSQYVPAWEELMHASG